MISLQWLSPDPHAAFPPVEQSLDEPAGLLAAGGDLSIPRLVNAYQHGIFPWFSEGEPILWWSPDPRFVLVPSQIKISRSLSKNVRNCGLSVTMDTAFEQVIKNCAQQPREGQDGTWITPEMQQAYINMHTAGHAHSVECWDGNQLVGGLYGIASGAVFCGESMFSKQSNVSKIALVHACRFLDKNGFKMIDSQVYTPHLESLGAKMIPRADYIKTLQQPAQHNLPKNWSAAFADYIKQSA